jgi:cytoplasmic iron level regulating protein YaaA (DUF328/UPF0246 family)
MDIINKKELEKLLGYKISDFSVKPKFNGDVFIGLDINVIKQKSIEFFENKITIQKSGSNIL